MTVKIRGDATASAAVMATGSVMFLAAAFMPISRVFIEGDPQAKLAILQADPVQWKAEQLLFAAGTVVLPVGVVMLTRHWKTGSDGGKQDPLAGQRLAQSAALLLSTGAVLFLVELEARYRDPEAFALGNLPMWPFHGYMWLSLAGMSALGGALLAPARGHANSGTLPRELRWPGWLNLGGAAVFAGALATTGDLPPLLVYGVELATAAALIRQLRRGKNPDVTR
ncbi:hypothetical protein [Pseudarthrobacter sp. NS4]|uniref:hypothetical protein n=1 Tax=Pseudarthrobacter sp. NS4 TaxID=2973976 RepID=UPI002161BE34|nr:hypothetical protein [Pseudarthrobacter sp. NS4]